MSIVVGSSLIKKYYSLCNLGTGGVGHALDLLARKPNTLITKKEISLFLRIKDGVYVANERIGGDEPTLQKICVIEYPTVD